MEAPYADWISGTHDRQVPATVGDFFHGGSPMQPHADRVMGLGNASDDSQ